MMKCIHELFEYQVERAGDDIAVEFAGQTLSYRDLNRRADELAQRLRELGVARDRLVGLFIERSLEIVVAVLGVLKAGGAYVPLDPVLPSKRLAHMIAQARPLVIVTQARLRSALPPVASAVVVIDVETVPEARKSTAASASPAREPCDLAYVIFTSGSTGEPKGVEIEDRAVTNMLASMQQRPGFTARDTLLAVTTLSFDISVLELLLPLVSGGRVVIAPKETIADGAALIEVIERSGATVFQATPATLQMLLDAGWVGDDRLKVLCGGEAWGAELARQLLSRCGSLWNMYGPTETTVWSAVAEVEADRPIVIGPPIARTALYVLDDLRRQVPVGVPGELFIAGAGLARGYFRRPELTDERFVADPFSNRPGARMYRAGDLVRRREDGALTFLGRIDDQVKIRGHRIELGEIEAVLERLPAIRQAALAVREDAHGEPRLVAFFIPEPGADPSSGDLRLWLSETLPSYMIPNAFVSVAAFPLTANGKLDRRALRAPTPPAIAETSTAGENLTAVEGTLAQIWRETLGVDRVGLHDNFFELGGHSMAAVRVVTRINQTLGSKLGVLDLFAGPTIEALAAALDRAQRGGDEGAAQNGVKVIKLREGRLDYPIYFIGAGPAEYHIAKALGGDQAIFAIDAPIPAQWQAAIAGGSSAERPTIEGLGALHAERLLRHLQREPCFIVGYSFGGKLAFETARAVRLAGKEIVAVLLIDAFTWRGQIGGTARRALRRIWTGDEEGKVSRARDWHRTWAGIAQSWRVLAWLLKVSPRAFVQRTRRPAVPSTMFDHEGRAVTQEVINRLALIAGESFQPQPIDAAGILLRAKFPHESNLPGLDSTNGWRDKFLRGLDIVQAAGDHESMVADERNRARLGRQMDAAIGRLVSRREFSRSSEPARSRTN